MSYNLLLDTGFNRIDKHWKLTNCTYENGYLKGNAKVYSIEQEIVLPDPTRLYFSLEYIACNKSIKSVYLGIQTNNIMEATKKSVKFHKRVRLSVVDKIKCERLKVLFIVEAETEASEIYIDSPLLVDLVANNKHYWPKSFLNKILDYRYGYNYENLYKESEISLTNEDFMSMSTPTEQANIGIIAHCKHNDWFRISYPFLENHYYLVKLDYKEINQYGNIYFKYGTSISTELNDQLYIIFKSIKDTELFLKIDNSEVMPYLLNLKHILIIDLANTNLTEADIVYLPFI